MRTARPEYHVKRVSETISESAERIGKGWLAG